MKELETVYNLIKSNPISIIYKHLLSIMRGCYDHQHFTQAFDYITKSIQPEPNKRHFSGEITDYTYSVAQYNELMQKLKDIDKEIGQMEQFYKLELANYVDITKCAKKINQCEALESFDLNKFPEFTSMFGLYEYLRKDKLFLKIHEKSQRKNFWLNLQETFSELKAKAQVSQRTQISKQMNTNQKKTFQKEIQYAALQKETVDKIRKQVENQMLEKIRKMSYEQFNRCGCFQKEKAERFEDVLAIQFFGKLKDSLSIAKDMPDFIEFMTKSIKASYHNQGISISNRLSLNNLGLGFLQNLQNQHLFENSVETKNVVSVIQPGQSQQQLIKTRKTNQDLNMTIKQLKQKIKVLQKEKQAFESLQKLSKEKEKTLIVQKQKLEASNASLSHKNSKFSERQKQNLQKIETLSKKIAKYRQVCISIRESVKQLKCDRQAFVQFIEKITTEQKTEAQEIVQKQFKVLLTKIEQIRKEEKEYRNSALEEYSRKSIQMQKNLHKYQQAILYNSYFEGKIKVTLRQKQVIIEEVLKAYSRNFYYKQYEVDKTDLIFFHPEMKNINFHELIDEKDNLLILMQIQNVDRLVVVYSEPKFMKEGNADQQMGAFLAVLENEEKCGENDKIYYLKKNNPKAKAMVYNDYYLVIGNSELRIKRLTDTLESNIPTNFQYFDTIREKSPEFMFGTNARETKIERYQIYQLRMRQKKQ